MSLSSGVEAEPCAHILCKFNISSQGDEKKVALDASRTPNPHRFLGSNVHVGNRNPNPFNHTDLTAARIRRKIARASTMANRIAQMGSASPENQQKLTFSTPFYLKTHITDHTDHMNPLEVGPSISPGLPGPLLLIGGSNAHELGQRAS